MSDSTDQKEFHWFCRKRKLSLLQPLVMGVLNVTPDSFYDGGRYVDSDVAFTRAGEMVAQGADIIDIGGESTRPGAVEVDFMEEIRRVCPLIKRVAEELDVTVSVDTRHLPVAEEALNAGAHIINNIMPLDESDGIAHLAAESGAGLVLMHMRGSPETMNEMTFYDDVLTEVVDRLRECVNFAVQNGVDRNQIVIDPGIGFAKETRHNLELIANLDQLCGIAPVLVGASRKRFIGELCNSADAADRVGGSIAAAVMSVLNGALVVRVHDVKESCQALVIANAIQELNKQG